MAGATSEIRTPQQKTPDRCGITTLLLSDNDKFTQAVAYIERQAMGRGLIEMPRIDSLGTENRMQKPATDRRDRRP